MFIEIQKRPFARPLFLLVLVILIVNKSFFSIYLPIGTLMLAIVFYIPLFSQKEIGYENRYLWGLVWSLLFVTATMLFVAYFKTSVDAHLDVDEAAFLHSIQSFKLQMIERVSSLPLTADKKSILSALVIGYKQFLPSEVRTSFSLSGVAHILAVSGFHVAVVAGFFSSFFSFLPKTFFFNTVRFLSMLLLVWSFVLFTGAAASSVRAGIMFSFYEFSRCYVVRTDRYNILFAAAFLMLLYNPFYLFDIGFQLSYFAVFSILVLYDPIRNLFELQNPIVSYFWNIMALTLAAQIGTLGLCLHYFGVLSFVFVLTSIPVTLLSTVLIPLTLLWLIFGDVLRFLSDWIVCLVDFLFELVGKFSEITSLIFPCRFNVFETILYYSVLLLLMVYCKTKNKRALFAALIAILFLLISLLANRVVAI